MNFSLRYAPRFVAAIVAAALVGCEKPDGLKELAEAKTAYEARDLKKAEKLLEKSLSCRADNVDALVAYTRVKLDLGEIPFAEEAIAKAAAIDPSASDVRLLTAQLAYHAKDYAKARQVFGAIAADDALDAKVRSQGIAGLGVVQMTENENDFARLSFLKAIRLDRYNASAWYHLGLIYERMGYMEVALDQYRAFVRVGDTGSRRVRDVQRVTIPKLEAAKARQAAERPGATKRDSASAAKSIALAEEAWKKSQFKTAKLRYQEACAADPLSYPAAIGLAKAWAKTDATAAGQKKTFECYRAACALKADAISTFITTGELAMRLGQHMTAVEIYSRAMAADPANLSAIDGLIRALRKVGGQAKVAAAYQEYRDLITPRKR